MAGHFRRVIATKLCQSLAQSGLVPEFQTNQIAERLASVVRVKKISKNHRLLNGQFQVSFRDLKALVGESHQANSGLNDQFGNSLSQNKSLKELEVTFDGKYFDFSFDPTNITDETLSAASRDGTNFGFTSHLHGSQSSCDRQHSSLKKGQTIVIEYSSPNIAKPFHAGHLRSTIIGNFISNLYQKLGYNVVRLNYLGDWGSQYGLLAAGFHRYGCEESLTTDPLQHLFEVYVKVNQDAAQEATAKSTQNASSLYQQGRDIFQKMERGDQDTLDLWHRFRDLSIKEYKKVYERLGISFSDIHGESMYSDSTLKLLQDLRHTGLLQLDEEKGVEYIKIPYHNRTTKATMCKSDGTTLYLTRDVTAAQDRKAKYNFDKIHYVVDNSQKQHFHNLTAVLKGIGEHWVSSLEKHFHIGFGRVLGMSTRKGKVILLKDILDEAQSQMLQKRKETATTKAVSDEMAVADILGISSIFVQDLKERRNTDYTFNWEKCLNFKADSGVFLQYAHARLCSLKLNCGVPLVDSIDCSLLKELSALRLILHISRYDEVIRDSLQDFEAHHVVQYLFQLVHLSNQALHSLVVKGQPQDVAQARLLLFHSTQQILSSGLQLIGVPPLDKM